MDIKVFLTVFITIFLSEIGDKSQIAALLYATDKDVNRWTVFAASASALVLATGIGIVAGGLLAKYIDPKLLNHIAGIGFIAVGGWILFRG